MTYKITDLKIIIVFDSDLKKLTERSKKLKRLKGMLESSKDMEITMQDINNCLLTTDEEAGRLKEFIKKLI